MGFIETYITYEMPKLRKIFKMLGVKVYKVIDVGCEIGCSAKLYKEFGAETIIGYEINEDYCRIADKSVFYKYFCREMELSEYDGYINEGGWFFNMDCEGCEIKYLNHRIPEYGLIAVHSWDQEYMELSERLWNAGYIPVFHSYDWKEIEYLKNW